MKELFKINNGVLDDILDKDITEVIIPDSVTEIGNCAFYNCTSHKNINIPDSVTKIGNFAFKDCINLESIIIPDSVTEIGNYVFEYCESLKKYKYS